MWTVPWQRSASTPAGTLALAARPISPKRTLLGPLAGTGRNKRAAGAARNVGFFDNQIRWDSLPVPCERSGQFAALLIPPAAWDPSNALLSSGFAKHCLCASVPATRAPRLVWSDTMCHEVERSTEGGAEPLATRRTSDIRWTAGFSLGRHMWLDDLSDPVGCLLGTCEAEGLDLTFIKEQFKFCDRRLTDRIWSFTPTGTAPQRPRHTWTWTNKASMARGPTEWRSGDLVTAGDDLKTQPLMSPVLCCVVWYSDFLH